MQDGFHSYGAPGESCICILKMQLKINSQVTIGIYPRMCVSAPSLGPQGKFLEEQEFTITPAPGLLCPLFPNARKRTVLGEPCLDTRREVANYRSKKIGKNKCALDVATSGSTVSLEEPVPPVGTSGESSLLSSAVKGGKSLSIECNFLEEMNQGKPWMVQGTCDG